MDSKFIPFSSDIKYFLGENLTLSNLSISTQNNYGQLDPMVKRSCDISFSLNTQEPYILILYKYKDFTATSVEGQLLPRHVACYDKFCLKGKITASFAGPRLDGIGTIWLIFDSPMKSKLFGHDYSQTCIWFKNKIDFEIVLEYFQKYWTHDIIIHPKFEETPKPESNSNLSPNTIQESKIPQAGIEWKCLDQKQRQSGAMRLNKIMNGIKKSFGCCGSLCISKEELSVKE